MCIISFSLDAMEDIYYKAGAGSNDLLAMPFLTGGERLHLVDAKVTVAEGKRPLDGACHSQQKKAR